MANSETNSGSTPEHVPATQSPGEIVDALYEDQVRETFQTMLPDAATTLKDLLASKSDSVRRLVANDIIEHGHERKSVNPLAGMLEDGKIHFTVNFIEFGQSEHGREVLSRESQEVSHLPLPPEDEIDDLEPVTLEDGEELVFNIEGPIED